MSLRSGSDDLSAEMTESGNDPFLLAVGDVAPLYPPDPTSPGSSEVWDHLRSA